MMLSRILLASCLTLTALADRYRFGISNITIHTTRDFTEDDLVLAVGAVSNGAEIGNATFYLGGGHNEDEVIALNNLTQEITISDRGANLSVAFGIVNIGDGDEAAAALRLGANILKVASGVGGVTGAAFSLSSILLDQVPDLLNCSGPVVLGSASYAPQDLQGLQLNQPVQGSETFTNEVPTQCSPTGADSNYEVTWYLEALERTGSGGGSSNGANDVKPGMVLPGVLGISAMFFAQFL